jgi:hypothetical protein
MVFLLEGEGLKPDGESTSPLGSLRHRRESSLRSLRPARRRFSLYLWLYLKPKI